jgi:hypothetical protein
VSERILNSQSVSYTKYSTPKRWNRPGLDHWWRPDHDPNIGFRSIASHSLSEPFKDAIVLDAKDYSDGTIIRITSKVALVAGTEITNE